MLSIRSLGLCLAKLGLRLVTYCFGPAVLTTSSTTHISWQPAQIFPLAARRCSCSSADNSGQCSGSRPFFPARALSRKSPLAKTDRGHVTQARFAAADTRARLLKPTPSGRHNSRLPACSHGSVNAVSTLFCHVPWPMKRQLLLKAACQYTCQVRKGCLLQVKHIIPSVQLFLRSSSRFS